MNHYQKVKHLLALAERGDFGSPDNQNRLSSGRAVFWRVFNGWVDPKEYKGTITYPYAVAGKKFAKIHK